MKNDKKNMTPPVARESAHAEIMEKAKHRGQALIAAERREKQAARRAQTEITQVKRRQNGLPAQPRAQQGVTKNNPAQPLFQVVAYHPSGRLARRETVPLDKLGAFDLARYGKVQIRQITNTPH